MALEFELNNALPTDIACDCIVVGIHADGQLTAAASLLDTRLGGRLSQWIKSGDIGTKLGKTTLLLGNENSASPRVLAVGLGDTDKFDGSAYIKAVSESIRALREGASRSALLTLTQLPITGRDSRWAVRQAVMLSDAIAYRYTATRKPTNNDSGLRRIILSAGEEARASLQHAIATAAGVTFARELGNLPPNICTPAYLAGQASQFATANAGVACEILEREQMQKLGMGALLGVAQGSANPPKLIVLRWNGGPANEPPYALVGKGITFDTGGISLKPGPGMEEMKFDMCGAAAVLGVFTTVVKLKLPVNLVVVVPTVENMPGGNACRPGDVVTTMLGKTVEILNTDAEGRLILCDALTYTQQTFKPKTIIDVATLTGACVVALGRHAHGLMSRHDDLAEELLAAGQTLHDRAWRLPIWDEYQQPLESGFADVANMGNKWAGAITAACFLARFTEGQRWAHLDIAGTAWEEGRKGLATGRPVGLLVQWLLDRVGT